ncbi:MAG: hypothetical protein RL710_1967 [Pseudomonadota bacterium]|jgi:hypothetical protein
MTKVTKAAPETPDAPEASPTAQAAPAAPADTTPSAGGSYLRDPVTGALTLITPSTVQE